jgi:hypothetical protein
MFFAFFFGSEHFFMEKVTHSILEYANILL